MFSVLLCLSISFTTPVVFVLSFSSVFFFFKQKTAYEMRISDWSSDVCSSDLRRGRLVPPHDVDRIVPHGDEMRPDAFQRPGRLLGIGRASCRERVCQYV